MYIIVTFFRLSISLLKLLDLLLQRNKLLLSFLGVWIQYIEKGRIGDMSYSPIAICLSLPFLARRVSSGSIF